MLLATEYVGSTACVSPNSATTWPLWITSPLVRARPVGTEPRSDPKMRSWSEKSSSRVDSLPFANAMASASVAASMPSSAGAFLSHDPPGGKYVATPPCASTDGRATSSAAAMKNTRTSRRVVMAVSV
jgi:hypothetical protein